MAAAFDLVVVVTVILVLDNHDSYTFNLAQALLELTAIPVRVVSVDAVDEALALVAADRVRAVVISPGPGHPALERDFGAADRLLDAVLDHPGLPLLGVCLGHQGLAQRFGYRVVPAPRPRHGHRSPLRHSGVGLFEGLPQGTLVTRYHSLAIEPVTEEPADAPAASSLRVTARSEDAVIQAFEVPGRPWWGVQFHPESIASEHGRQLLANFLRLAGIEVAGGADRAGAGAGAARPADDGAGDGDADSRQQALRLRSRTIPLPEQLSPDAATAAVLRQVLVRGRGSFWLRVPEQSHAPARWTLLGDVADPSGEGRAAAFRFRAGSPQAAASGRLSVDQWPPTNAPDAAPQRTSVELDDHVAWLDELLTAPLVEGGEQLPFRGGVVGFFGYEAGLRSLGVPAASAVTPDACWLRPERWFLIDHERRSLIACAIARDDETARSIADAAASAAASVFSTSVPASAAALAAASSAAVGVQNSTAVTSATAHVPADTVPPAPIDMTPTPAATTAEAPGRWRLDAGEYADRIARCQQALRAGDSYELCLTTAFEVDARLRADPLELFLELLQHNPAPYAALLELDDGGEPLAVVSASPECFLAGRDGAYRTRPIKGTAPRDVDPVQDAALADSLREDPKVYAEHLMIVDLLRNDLGRVSMPGSVRVPDFMTVEAHPTVHQLVSTVVGRSAGAGSVEVAAALFPGGSMTGAPKLRSVQLLSALEGAPRGVYSGALGMFGYDGAVSLSIVIRTAVLAAGRWTIGAGGAIVLDSDPDAEIAEVRLKARALRRALARVAQVDGDAGPSETDRHAKSPASGTQLRGE